jgi:hypothetical protein
MIDLEQQKSNDLLEGSVIEIAIATSQLELTQGPFMPVQKS